MRIIEFEPYQYINIRRLEKLGFTKEKLREYGSQVWSYLVDDGYFTIQSIRNDGFSSELDGLGFGDLFYASILKEDERFSWQKVGNAVVFNPKGNSFTIHDFLVDYITNAGSVNVDDFSLELRERFGIELDRYSIIEKVKGNIFEKHIFPTFRNVLISEITDDDIAEWQAKMKNFVMPNGKHFSKSFLRTIQSQFNSIINYANSKGYLHQNPLADIKNMGIKDKRVEFWSTSEYERFAYYAMKYPNYYYAFEVLYWCGLREGEMLALTLQDIDLEQAVIYVNKTYQRFHRQDIISTPKTPSSVRKVSMPAFLCDELKEYIDMLYSPAPDQRIFTITKSKLTHRFHKLSEEAGLRRITVHGLRHSHVSLLISKKYDIFEVSKRIGHKSIKTTQDIYGHLFDEVQKTIANDLDSLRRR